MTDTKDEDKQNGRKRNTLQQLVSIAIHGSNIRTEPGTDPDKIGDNDT